MHPLLLFVCSAVIIQHIQIWLGFFWEDVTFRLGFLVGKYSFDAWAVIILDCWLQSDVSTADPLRLCLLRCTQLSCRLCQLDRSTKYKSHASGSSFGKSLSHPLVGLQTVQAWYCCLSIPLGGPSLIMTKFEEWGKRGGCRYVSSPIVITKLCRALVMLTKGQHNS